MLRCNQPFLKDRKYSLTFKHWSICLIYAFGCCPFTQWDSVKEHCVGKLMFTPLNITYSLNR